MVEKYCILTAHCYSSCFSCILSKNSDSSIRIQSKCIGLQWIFYLIFLVMTLPKSSSLQHLIADLFHALLV